MLYASGAVYDGEWLDDRRHGTGKMVFQGQGGVYEGGWRLGLQEGFGDHWWPAGGGQETTPSKNRWAAVRPQCARTLRVSHTLGWEAPPSDSGRSCHSHTCL